MAGLDVHNLLAIDLDRFPLLLCLRDAINRTILNNVMVNLNSLFAVRTQLILALCNLGIGGPYDAADYDLVKQISVSLSFICAEIVRM